MEQRPLSAGGGSFLHVVGDGLPDLPDLRDAAVMGQAGHPGVKAARVPA